MDTKVLFKCLLSSIFIFIPLFLVLNVNYSIQYRIDDLSRLDQNILVARSNLLRLNKLLSFVKRLNGNINIRVEPVRITAEFSAINSGEKIDEVVNSTYKKGGIFFLDNFRLAIAGKENGSEESTSKSNACYLELSLKGSRVVIFGMPQ